MNEKTANQKRRLSWKVVGEDGGVLAIVDSESEAFFFTRYRAHAASAETVFSGIDYSAAPELLEALEAVLFSAEAMKEERDGINGYSGEPESFRVARAAIAKARGEKGGAL